jgi:hypothetical protein
VSSVSARALVAGSAVAGLLLVVVSLALGGASYKPAAVQDPCQSREWQAGSGLDHLAQQLTLSALDGAACELHVSRETLVISLASADGRKAFTNDPRLADALRAGLIHAIDDAESSGAIPGLVATGLREIAANLPVDQLITSVRDANGLLGHFGISVPGISSILGGG